MNDPTDTVHANGREGMIAGLLGASVVAVFYLLFDVGVRGEAMITPSVLGEVLLMRRPDPSLSAVNGTAVGLYTLVHGVAFILFGMLLTALAHRSEHSDLARYAVVQVFIVFLVFFYGLLAVASSTTRGVFPFWSVLAANLLAAATMGTYLWKAHPRIRAAILRNPLGAAREEGAVTNAPQA